MKTEEHIKSREKKLHVEQATTRKLNEMKRARAKKECTWSNDIILRAHLSTIKMERIFLWTDRKSIQKKSIANELPYNIPHHQTIGTPFPY